MKCTRLLKRCGKCGLENNGLPTCPDCGTDLHCKKDAVSGYTGCASHGGPVPSRNFYGVGTMTTGSGSSFPLTRLAAQYNKMMKDGQVLSNRAAINIIDTRITQLLGRIDFDEAPDRLAKLNELWSEYVNSDGVDAAVLKKQISDEFEKVYHDYMAWRQIFDALDLRGKSVEREVKVLKEIKAIMTAEDGYELAAKIMAAVIRVIGDEPKKIKQVQYEFARIIGESSDLVTERHLEDDGRDGEATGGTPRSGDMDQAQLLHPRNEE
jgi:hypothetical protein